MYRALYRSLKITLYRQSTQVNGISYRDRFRYQENGFFCWMLLHKTYVCVSFDQSRRISFRFNGSFWTV